MSGDKKMDALAMLYQDLKQANDVLSLQEIAEQIYQVLGRKNSIVLHELIEDKATKI